MINHIVIAGTGFGGWYTALSLLNNLDNVKITLIGSSKIPKLRVGESLAFDSPYNLKRLLKFDDDRIFMRATGSIYKYGTTYHNISDDNLITHQAKIHNLKVSSLVKFFGGFDYPDFHEYWNHQEGDFGVQQAWIWDYQQNPKSWEDYNNELGENTHFVSNPIVPYNRNNDYVLRPTDGFSYHMDADKTAELIAKIAQEKYSNRITVIDDIIVGVDTDAQGSVTALKLQNSSTVRGDIYCDLTGTKQVLVKAVNNQSWRSVNNYSCNSALVFPTLYTDPTKQIVGATTFTGDNYGWLFRINLYHRAGNGFVFRNDMLTKEQAFEKLQNIYGDDINPMYISWDPGYLEQPWMGNVVAMGISSNFISPFDANVISTHSRGIENLIKIIQESTDVTNVNLEQQYNQLQKPIHDEIDYRLKLLFGFSKRSGPYWDLVRDMAEKENLAELLENIICNKLKHLNGRITWNWSQQYSRTVASCKVDISKYNLPKPSDRDFEMCQAYWKYMSARNKYIRESIWPNYYEWIRTNRFDGLTSEEILEELNPDLINATKY